MHHVDPCTIWQPPCGVPRHIAKKLLRGVPGENNDPPPTAMWQPAFTQPCTDYCHFKQMLHMQSVALEYVHLKDDEGRISGTVMVKNVAFEKRVFVRHTADDWVSFQDQPCIYQQVRHNSSFFTSTTGLHR